MPSCKSNIKIKKQDCFYESNNFVYLNFYNISDNERLIPNIVPIINDDFDLSEYSLTNDTLYINLLNPNKTKIAGSDSPHVVGTISYLKVKKNERIQQVFKVDEKFNVVTLLYKEQKLSLIKCK